MATTPIHLEGFESGFVAGTGASTIQSSTKRTGTYSLRCNPVTTGTASVNLLGFGADGAAAAGGVSAATAYVRFYFYIATLPSADEAVASALTSGASIKLGLRLTSTGTLKVYNNGFASLLHTSAALSTATWYRIELKVTTGTPSSAWEIKIDGTSSGSGTSDLLNTNFAYVRFGKHTDVNGSGYDCFYDDVRIDTDDYPGAGGILRMDADGVGTDTAWLSSGGGAAVHTEVDNIPFTDGGVYSYTTTNPSAQTYTLESASNAGIAGTIGGVKTMAFCRDIGGTSALAVRLRSGANTDTTSTANIGGYDINGKVYALEPTSAAAWTTTLLNSVQVGVVSEATEQTRCQGIALEVEFVAAVGNAPAAPSLLVATLNAGVAVDLVWQDNAGAADDQEDEFEVQHSLYSDFDPATTITGIAQDAEAYQVTGLEPTSTYYFRIRAVNGVGNSAWSNTDSEATSTTSVSTHTQDEIVCTFDTTYVRGRYVCGGGYFFVADGSGNFTLSSVAEEAGTSGSTIAGVMVDPSSTTLQGFDTRLSNYSAGLNEALPLTVNVSGGAKTIWVSLRLDTPEVGGGNSGMRSIVQLTIVPSAPDGLIAIKPTGYGSAAKRLVTTANINFDLITTTAIPVGATEPDWELPKYHTRPFIRIGGTVNSAWIAPTLFQASYPGTQTFFTGSLLLGAISNAAHRNNLICRIVRCYLDIAQLGALGDTTFITVGGFGSGGKGMWFFGGLFLGDSLTLPANVTYSGLATVDFFGEDGVSFLGDADAEYPNGKPLYGRDHTVGYTLYANHDLRDLDGVREPHWLAFKTGTAQATSSTSITLAAGVADVAAGYLVYATDNDETREITAWDNGTKVATVAAWSVTPASNTTYEVYNGGGYQEIASYALTAVATAVVLANKVSSWNALGGTGQTMLKYVRRWIEDEAATISPRWPFAQGGSDDLLKYDDTLGTWTKQFYLAAEPSWPSPDTTSTPFLTAGGSTYKILY